MSAMEHSQQKAKKKKPKFVQEDSPEPPSSGYEPPKGFKPLEYDTEAEKFDWDAVNNDPNLEIWAIRLPMQLKPKYLDKMSFPLSQTGSTGAPIARISAGKKQTQYDITVASSSTGAEEMKGMACLLPRRTRGGKLFIAQKPLAGHLLLSESPVASTSAVRASLSPTFSPNAMHLLNSRRFSHPAHLLKHKYTPTSARRPDARPTVVAEPDATMREGSHMGQPTAFMEIDGPAASRPGSPTKPHKKRKKGDEEIDGDRYKKGKKKRTEIDG